MSEENLLWLVSKEDLRLSGLKWNENMKMIRQILNYDMRKSMCWDGWFVRIHEKTMKLEYFCLNTQLYSDDFNQSVWLKIGDILIY